MMLTGGVRELRGEPPTPALMIDDSRTEDEWLAELGRLFALAPVER
jgi:hypothetical protein